MVRREEFDDERFGLLTNTLQLGIDASSAIGHALHLRKPNDLKYHQVGSLKEEKRLVKGKSRST